MKNSSMRPLVGESARPSDELDHALDADDVIELDVVQVPAFDHPGQCRRHVELAELEKELIV
jgi:hypothetical protein